MAESAHRFRKKLLGRRVVHVDIVRIREQEFDSSERVVVAGRLAHRKRNRLAICPPVHRPGADDAALRVQDLVSLPVEVSPVPGQMRHHFITDDRLRHAPIGVDHDCFHFVAEHRRLGVGLAHDHLRAPGDAFIVHDAQLECGLIDQHVPLAQFPRQPTQPFHVHHELLRIVLIGF